MKCIISFSFDDGRIDSYTEALPILKRYNLPATFNITTGYVEDHKRYGSPTGVPPMTMGMVKEIYEDSNYEIAGHGFRHRNDIEDITKGLSELKKQLGTKQLTRFGDGFASPGTGLDAKTWSFLNGGGNGSIRYARLSLRYLNHGALKSFARKICRIIHLPSLYAFAYKDTLMNTIKDGILYSIPVLSSIRISELKAVIKYAERYDSACILMFHSIAPKDKVHNNWDYEKGKFEELCKFLSSEQKEGKLIVRTTMELFEHLEKE